MSGGSLCFPDELLNSAVHDAASGKPRITPSAYMIIRDATRIQQALETLYSGIGGEYHYGDDAWNYVKDRTNIDLFQILSTIARENTAKNGN
jgi:hypothetical protein